MNLKGYRVAMVIVAAALLAMILQGCSSDDSSGISQDMYDALNAEKTAAEAEASAAKAAQATAEAAETAAKAAQAEAEAAEAAAEAEAMTAKAAEMAAKAAETAAVAAQAVAESEAKAAMAAQTKAEADLEAAETALAAANEAKTAAETAQAVAESEAKAAKEAQAAAETAKMAAEVAQKAAEKAQADAEAAQKMAEADRDRYKKMYEDATDVDTVGSTVGAAARAVAARIAGSVMGATQDSAAMQAMKAMTEKGIAVKKLMRDDDGVSFSVMEGAVARMTSADAADDAAPSLTGLQGVALAATGGGVMQEALVYTDIEKSVTPFSSKYPYNSNVVLATTGDAGAVATTGAVPTYRYIGASSALGSIGGAANTEIVMAHNLSSDITTRRLDDTIQSGETSPAPVYAIRGSYDGVPGQYVCDGVCDFTWGPRAIALSGSGTFYFKADSIETLIPDPDYHTFGVWMIAQDGPAAAGYVRPIAMANATAFDHENFDDLRGSATYTGQAAGYYATRAAGSAEATSGRFTATATLKANFDAPFVAVVASAAAEPAADRPMGGPIALNEDREVVAGNHSTAMYYRAVVPSSGVSFAGSQIHKFMAEDGTEMAGWVVNLDGGALRRPADVMVNPVVSDDISSTLGDDTSASGQRANARNAVLDAMRATDTFEGATSGTGYAMTWDGVWDASFHGTNTGTLPTGVVGTFQADAGMANPAANDDGAIDLYNDPGFAGVVGSFGARR